jgi:hypothetical protein
MLAKYLGEGTKPERSRGEILCFFFVLESLKCLLGDSPLVSTDTKCHVGHRRMQKAAKKTL